MFCICWLCRLISVYFRAVLGDEMWRGLPWIYGRELWCRVGTATACNIALGLRLKASGRVLALSRAMTSTRLRWRLGCGGFLRSLWRERAVVRDDSYVAGNTLTNGGTVLFGRFWGTCKGNRDIAVVGCYWRGVIVAEEVTERFFFTLGSLWCSISIHIFVFRVDSIRVLVSSLCADRTERVLVTRSSIAEKPSSRICGGLGHLRRSEAVLRTRDRAAGIDGFSHSAIA